MAGAGGGRVLVEVRGGGPAIRDEIVQVRGGDHVPLVPRADVVAVGYGHVGLPAHAERTMVFQVEPRSGRLLRDPGAVAGPERVRELHRAVGDERAHLVARVERVAPLLAA